MSIIQDEDPDVDVLETRDSIRVFVDLRGREISTSSIAAKVANRRLYLYDRSKNVIVKVIELPSNVEPKSIQTRESNRTISITLTKNTGRST